MFFTGSADQNKIPVFLKYFLLFFQAFGSKIGKKALKGA